jgi:hypothetical protein
MSRSQTQAVGTADVARIEAPVSIRAYLLCAFASFGGILFGYDSGYISGVIGMVGPGLFSETDAGTDLHLRPMSKGLWAMLFLSQRMNQQVTPCLHLKNL